MFVFFVNNYKVKNYAKYFTAVQIFVSRLIEGYHSS
jgi:hypothetical protein